MESTQVRQEAPRARTWHWAWGLGLAVAALAFFVGPLAIPLLGAGLLAGGLFARHESDAARDRAIAGGLAAAGGAILLATVLLLAFLMPARVSIDAGVTIDEVQLEAAD